jgi:lysophospholipase L1-like esterase
MRTLLAILFALPSLAATPLEMEAIAWTNGPLIALAGDSIASGYPSFTPKFAGGGTESGNTAYDLARRLQTVRAITATNFAWPGHRWDQVLNNDLVPALATRPKYVFVHCGINDIAQSVSWSTAQSNMDGVLAKCVSSNAVLLVGQLFPDSAVNATVAATVRTWNTNYATWAAGKNPAQVRLITDASGFQQTRPATGYPDDLKAEFDYGDGVHLTLAGYEYWDDTLSALLDPVGGSIALAGLTISGNITVR